jgi:hypothetical protein
MLCTKVGVTNLVTYLCLSGMWFGVAPNTDIKTTHK